MTTREIRQMGFDKAKELRIFCMQDINDDDPPIHALRKMKEKLEDMDREFKKIFKKITDEGDA